MKISKKIKKCFVSMIVGCTVFFSANTLSAFAETTIDDVSVSKPVSGVVETEGGSLNVRQYANTTSSIVASLPNDCSVMIVGQEGNFYRVQYNNSGSYGYVSKDYVYFVPSGYYLKANTSGGNLNMRYSAATNSQVVASIPNGTSFAYMRTNFGWYYGLYGITYGATSPDYTILCSF